MTHTCVNSLVFFEIFLFHEMESAKLRAPRAKNVLTFQPTLRAYVLTCQCALRTCFARLRAHVPTCYF